MAAPDLSHLKPCAERWDAMAPAGDGVRLCGGCGRLVHDFRGLPDGALAEAHRAGPVCGVYTDRQLARGGARPATAPGSFRRGAAAWGSALAALALSGPAHAQAGPPPQAEAPADPRVTGEPPSIDSLVVWGRVTDAYGAGLPGASVYVEGTALGTAADVDGRYHVDLTPLLGSGQDASIVLKASFVGFHEWSAVLPRRPGRREVDVLLAEQEALGEVAFYAVAPEPWSLVGWLRRRLGI